MEPPTLKRKINVPIGSDNSGDIVEKDQCSDSHLDPPALPTKTFGSNQAIDLASLRRRDKRRRLKQRLRLREKKGLELVKFFEQEESKN
jgi:hypothetical protein